MPAQSSEGAGRHPGQILATSSAYWRSFTLQTAVRLDVFTLIGDATLPVARIAGRLGCDERGLATLLDAIVAMGLLRKADDRYVNTEEGRAFLVRSSPRYVGHLIRHHANLAEAWARLEESVRTGEPARGRSSGSTGATREDFLRGMHVQAMGIAPRTVKDIDLQGRNRLLDLGGGPGTWAIHFALHDPGLTATVVDLPGTRPFAEETIARFGVADRVSFHGADYTIDPLPRGFDVAWLSHILHAEGPETCRAILRRTVDSLAKGSLVFVHEFILDEGRTGPLFPALFSLNMLLGTHGGRSYTQRELEEMLGEAGVGKLRLLDFIGPTESRILTGVVIEGPR